MRDSLCHKLWVVGAKVFGEDEGGAVAGISKYTKVGNAASAATIPWRR
jgi:hypothetical protein